LLWIFLGIVLTPADVGFGAYVAASLPAQVCEPAPVIARSEADLLGAL
jgi:hypothetical protein